MADVFGMIRNSIDKSVATVSIKSNEFVEITRLKTLNSKLEKEIELEKKQLGAVYYNQWKNESFLEVNLISICNLIKEREEIIANNLIKIEELQRQNNEVLNTFEDAGKIVCKCGYTNTLLAKFCINCGEKIQQTTNIENSDEGKICSCGQINKNTAKFCVGCGTMLLNESNKIQEINENFDNNFSSFNESTELNVNEQLKEEITKEDTIICICGQELSATVKFCGKCGNRL